MITILYQLLLEPSPIFFVNFAHSKAKPLNHCHRALDFWLKVKGECDKRLLAIFKDCFS